MSPRPWTEPEIEMAKALWKEGLSATEVGRLITAKFRTYRSRNSVIGRLHRSGCVRTAAQTLEVWRRRSAEVAGFKEPRVKVAKAVNVPEPARNVGMDQASKSAAVKANGGSEAYVESGAGVASPNARPFQQRRLGQCAWPLGERALTSCCNAVAGGEGFGATYCSGHLKALLAPVQPKAAKASDYVRKDDARSASRSTWDGGRIAA